MPETLDSRSSRPPGSATWGSRARGPGRMESPPSWWPSDEPWPPHDRRHWRRAMRHSPFARRFGCMFMAASLFAIMLVVAVSGAVLRALDMPLLRVWSTAAVYGAAGLFLVLALVSFAITAANLSRTARTLDELVEASERVAEGDYSTRVKEAGPRETRSMAKAFNAMAARLEAEDRQRRAMLADVTHELRTPLTVIKGSLEGFLDGLYPADEVRLNSLLEEVDLLTRLADDMRMLVAAETSGLDLRTEETDLGALVAETVLAFGSAAQAANVRIELEQPLPEAVLDLDPERIRQVLSNLLVNALKHSAAGGVIRVGVSRSGAADGRTTEISVVDEGSGIAADDLPHIFERYYKSADSRGLGIGLSIAKFIVEAHGGKIEAASAPGQGTTFRFSLPG